MNADNKTRVHLLNPVRRPGGALCDRNATEGGSALVCCERAAATVGRQMPGENGASKA